MITVTVYLSYTTIAISVIPYTHKMAIEFVKTTFKI